MSIDWSPRRPSAAELERRIALARARGIRSRDIDLGPDLPPYDPANPLNNTTPAASSVTAFPLFGCPATYLHDISFIANTIPKDAYPVNTVQIYLGMNRVLTQMECDHLNGVTP